MFEVGGRANPRREEYEKMEKWKEENCKLCPNCGRVIEKLEGCDAMKCGTDYHGGSVQNGCGADFTWSTAQKYKRNQGTDAPVGGRHKGLRDWMGRMGVDMGVDRATYVCEECWKDIPPGEKRFKCIHCRDGFTVGAYVSCNSELTSY